MKYIKDGLPKGGIFSQAVHMKLFERFGLQWKLEGCYIRDARYFYEEGEAKSEPLENVVLACKHIKEHIDDGNDNPMFTIRVRYLKIFCKKRCDVGNSIFQ